jgi:hypothetical protein
MANMICFVQKYTTTLYATSKTLCTYAECMYCDCTLTVAVAAVLCCNASAVLWKLERI